MKADDVPLLAAGVAFFAMLASSRPRGLVSVYGLMTPRGSSDVEDSWPLRRGGPGPVTTQLSAIVELTVRAADGAIVGLMVALWSASSAVKHLIGASTWPEDETRGSSSLGLALGAAGVGGWRSAGLIVFPDARRGHRAVVGPDPGGAVAAAGASRPGGPGGDLPLRPRPGRTP